MAAGKFIATLPKSQKLSFRLRDSCKDVNRKKLNPGDQFLLSTAVGFKQPIGTCVACKK
jgi:hypothetical protein